MKYTVEIRSWNVLPILDVRKIIKLLVKVLTGDDSWVQATEFLTVIRVETTIVHTPIWDPLFTDKYTILKRPNMSTLHNFRKLGIYTGRDVLHNISENGTTACEVLPVLEVIIFLGDSVHELFNLESRNPSTRSVSLNSFDFFTTLTLVSPISRIVQLLESVQDTLLVRCTFFNLFVVDRRWIRVRHHLRLCSRVHDTFI